MTSVPQKQLISRSFSKKDSKGDLLICRQQYQANMPQCERLSNQPSDKTGILVKLGKSLGCCCGVWVSFVIRSLALVLASKLWCLL